MCNLIDFDNSCCIFFFLFWGLSFFYNQQMADRGSGASNQIDGLVKTIKEEDLAVTEGH